MQLRQAIAHYHALLDEPAAGRLFARLAEGQRARRMLVGPARDRLVCAVLRPRFVTRAQYESLTAAAALVGRAIQAVGAAAVADESLLAPYALAPGELELLRIDPGFPGASAFGRLDGFLSDDGDVCFFVESNLESPAGIAYDEAIAEIFDGSETLAAFRDSYRAEPLPVRPRLQQLLLDTFRAWGGQGTPTVAIVDFPGVVTWSEFEHLRDRFAADGVPTVLAGPDDLRYAGGRLYAGGTPVDMVYRRILLHEFLRAFDLSHPLVRAYRDRAVCLVNPLRTKPVHTKLIMALVSDEEGPAAGVLGPEERAAVARHVPWSRHLRPGPTRHAGERVDLPAFALARRERLVLKPNDDYGGKGVLLGWETPRAEWEAAVERALAGPEPWVVQERVPVPSEPFPTWSPEGGLQISERYVDSDPLVFGAEALGCLTRIAATALLNVSAGGGSAPPTFLIEPR